MNQSSLFIATFNARKDTAKVKSSLFYHNIQNAQKETAKDNSVTL